MLLGKNIGKLTVPAWVQLLIFAFVIYWPVSSFCFSLKWDMLDTILPWRYYVSECLRNLHFPLWNPYQQCGYPIFADLRSVWSAEILLTSYFFGASLYLLHFLMILYLFLAGLGMFKLLKLFEVPHDLSLVGGIVYMCSGYMVSQGQDMVRIIAGTGLPFVLYFYLRFLQHQNLKSLLSFCLVFYFMISAAYQAVTIILCYLLLSFFLYELYQLYRVKAIKKIKTFLNYHAILMVMLVVLVLPLVSSYLQSKAYVSRFSGLDLKWSEFLPFSPSCSFSFLVPFATVKNDVLFNTDVSMRNAYFGVFSLLFFILSLFKTKSSYDKILLAFGFLSLLASFGSYLPVRAFLYDYVPLMNMFRMPAYFVLFFSFSALILAFRQIALYREQKETHSLLLKKIWVFFLGLYLVIMFFSFFNIDFNHFSNLKSISLPANLLDEGTFYEHVFIQSSLQFFLLSILFYFLIKKSNKFIFFLKLFVLLDIVLSVQLNVFYTISDLKNPQQIQAYIDSSPKGFPVPKNQSPIENTDLESSFASLWRNTNIYEKRFSAQGFNSFCLDGLNKLEEDSLLHSITLSNQLLFLSDNICSETQWSNKEIFDFRKLIVVSDSAYNQLKKLPLACGSKDTCYFTGFKPTEFKVKVHAEHQLILTLLQSNFVGWKVYVDGNEVSYFPSNKNFISLLVPTGKHEIVFKYENQAVFYAGMTSFAFLFLLLSVCLYLYFIRNKNRRVKFLILIVLILVFVYGFLIPKLYADKYIKSYEIISKVYSKWKSSYSNDALFFNNVNPSTNKISLHAEDLKFVKNHKDLISVYDFLEKTNKPLLVYFENNVRFRDELNNLIGAYYPLLLAKEESGIFKIELRKKSKTKKVLFQHKFDLLNEGEIKNVLNNQNQFSREFLFTKQNLDFDRENGLLFLLKVKINASLNSAPQAVLQVNEAGKLKSWNAFQLKADSSEKEQLIFYFYKPNQKEEIKLFIWNPSASAVVCKEIALEVY
jgi:hypothetical protein